MRRLTAVAWVAVFAVFAFGVWAVRQPEPVPLAAEAQVRPTPGPVVLTPTSVAPQILTQVVPVIRTITVPSPTQPTTPTTAPTTPTTAPPTCLVFLVDHCVTFAPG